MKFNQLKMNFSFFSDDYKMLKNIFPLFWQNFIIFEEEKMFFILVIINIYINLNEKRFILVIVLILKEF